jgi:hypothetical protein
MEFCPRGPSSELRVPVRDHRSSTHRTDRKALDHRQRLRYSGPVTSSFPPRIDEASRGPEPRQAGDSDDVRA